MSYSIDAAERIKWPEVFSLLLLIFSVNISWIAYNEYQPQLLQDLGLQAWSVPVGGAKTFALVVMPILAGWWFDRLTKVSPKSIMLITAGIAFTSVIFGMVTGTLALPDPGLQKQALPVLIILWLLAMNVFYAPAHSLMREFSALSKLPVAMGVVVFGTELIQSLEPLVVKGIQVAGPVATFGAGGVLILTSGLLFQRVARDEVRERSTQVEEEQEHPFSWQAAVFAGVLVGLAHAAILHVFPFLFRYHPAGFFGIPDAYLSFLFLLVAALLAPGAARLVKKAGVQPTLFAGILGFTFSLVFLLISREPIWLFTCGLLCGAALSVLSVAAFPYIVEKVSVARLGTATGIYLGLSELADNFFEVMGVLEGGAG